MSHSPRKKHWNLAAAKCDGHCWYCGCVPEPGEITVDHAKPRSRGGPSVGDNLLPACDYCNNLKSNLTVSEFRKYCKVSIIRDLMALGYFSGDVSALRIIFYGEGNAAPLGW